MKLRWYPWVEWNHHGLSYVDGFFCLFVLFSIYLCRKVI
jgi:hypothetical protein